MTPEGKGSVVPISMMTALRATVDKVPDQIALGKHKSSHKGLLQNFYATESTIQMQ